jgi:hypothetical protein
MYYPKKTVKQLAVFLWVYFTQIAQNYTTRHETLFILSRFDTFVATISN